MAVFAVTSDARITKNQAKGWPDHQKIVIKFADALTDEQTTGQPGATAEMTEGATHPGSSRTTFGLETADDRPLVGV